MAKQYDLIIIGAGPAGLTAALYASRYKINTLALGDPFSSSVCGAHLLENWPGEEKITGIDLIRKMSEQVKKHGVEILGERVTKISAQGGKNDLFKIITEVGQEFSAKSLIIASGAERKKLEIKGEKEFVGRGVAYCATCDAAFFKNKIIAVVGAGNAALMAADLLASYGQKVYLINRNKEFGGEPAWQDKIFKNEKIKIIFERNVVEIKGQNKVEEIILDKEFEKSLSLKVDGLFIEIGSQAVTGTIKELGIELDEKGYIKIKKDGSTNIAGVFAAGDITNGSNGFSQVITACSEGAIAALGVYNYLPR